GRDRGHGTGRGAVPAPLRQPHRRRNPMTTVTRRSAFADERESDWTGLITFAGIMMVVAGVWHALAGIAALLNDNLYISTPNYVYSLDLTGWGWGHLVLGALATVTG